MAPRGGVSRSLVLGFLESEILDDLGLEFWLENYDQVQSVADGLGLGNVDE
jgi:hypothetical protein